MNPRDALFFDYINADTDNHERMLRVKRVSQITLLHSPVLDAIDGVATLFPPAGQSTPIRLLGQHRQRIIR